MQAAVRTIIAGCANDAGSAFRQPTVRRRAGSVFLATHASWRLFYGPYIGSDRTFRLGRGPKRARDT
jgi:hypothetical protein